MDEGDYCRPTYVLYIRSLDATQNWQDVAERLSSKSFQILFERQTANRETAVSRAAAQITLERIWRQDNYRLIDKPPRTVIPGSGKPSMVM